MNISRHNKWWLALSLMSGVARGATPAPQDGQYEYVIIGSGPGGGPLGANLARKGHSVLIIEAGEDNVEHRLQQMPGMANAVAEDPDMSWEFWVNHYSDAERAHRDSKFTWELNNGSYYMGTDPPADAEPLGTLYPRVGTLGGCGNHNALGLTLPPDNDWNYIAEVTGDHTWNAQHMRKYFERLEKCHYLPIGTPGHGFSGWLGTNQNDVSVIEPDDGLFSIISSGMTLTGTAKNPSKKQAIELLKRDVNRLDPARYEKNGLYLFPLHEDEQRRRSSAGTYLKDTVNEVHHNGSQRYPLSISTSSLATKLIYGNSTGSVQRVVGVEYMYGAALYKADKRFDGLRTGAPMKAFATKEVIVAGGVFNTPQILMLSGIGPRDELEKFDIPVKVELPAVGTNLQDNYEIGFEALASTDFINAYENCTNLAPNDPCVGQWADNATGPYSQGPVLGMLYRSSESETKDADLYGFGGVASAFRGFFPGFSRVTAPANLLWWSIVKMQPKNRAGTVTLRSANPHDVPIINFNSFQQGAESELRALAEGIDFALQIVNNTDRPWAPFQQTFPEAGKNVSQQIMDEAWGHHASCSCPMGTDNNTSVVDSRFMVHGFENLRVVDGSIFPRVPGGFPILPLFMVSEKATDVILEDSKKGQYVV